MCFILVSFVILFFQIVKFDLIINVLEGNLFSLFFVCLLMTRVLQVRMDLLVIWARSGYEFACLLNDKLFLL